MILNINLSIIGYVIERGSNRNALNLLRNLRISKTAMPYQMATSYENIFEYWSSGKQTINLIDTELHNSHCEFIQCATMFI